MPSHQSTHQSPINKFRLTDSQMEYDQYWLIGALEGRGEVHTRKTRNNRNARHNNSSLVSGSGQLDDQVHNSTTTTSWSLHHPSILTPNIVTYLSNWCDYSPATLKSVVTLLPLISQSIVQVNPIRQLAAAMNKPEWFAEILAHRLIEVFDLVRLSVSSCHSALTEIIHEGFQGPPNDNETMDQPIDGQPDYQPFSIYSHNVDDYATNETTHANFSQQKTETGQFIQRIIGSCWQAAHSSQQQSIRQALVSCCLTVECAGYNLFKPETLIDDSYCQVNIVQPYLIYFLQVHPYIDIPIHHRQKLFRGLILRMEKYRLGCYEAETIRDLMEACWKGVIRTIYQQGPKLAQSHLNSDFIDKKLIKFSDECEDGTLLSDWLEVTLQNDPSSASNHRHLCQVLVCPILLNYSRLLERINLTTLCTHPAFCIYFLTHSFLPSTTQELYLSTKISLCFILRCASVAWGDMSWDDRNKIMVMASDAEREWQYCEEVEARLRDLKYVAEMCAPRDDRWSM